MIQFVNTAMLVRDVFEPKTCELYAVERIALLVGSGSGGSFSFTVRLLVPAQRIGTTETCRALSALVRCLFGVDAHMPLVVVLANEGM